MKIVLAIISVLAVTAPVASWADNRNVNEKDEIERQVKVDIRARCLKLNIDPALCQQITFPNGSGQQG